MHSSVLTQWFYLHQIWWCPPDKWVLIWVKHSMAMCQRVYSDLFGCLRCGCGLIWVHTLVRECLFMSYKLSLTSCWWTHLRVLIFHSSIPFRINWDVGLLLFQLHGKIYFFRINCFLRKFDTKSQTFFRF